MSDQQISTAGPGHHADVLDHASEFVALVCRRAPSAYEVFLTTPRFRELLRRENSFNHGKLFAWAEFSVFRQEFFERFPEASGAACINTFSRLFLKNDISITNLVEVIEGAGERERLFRSGAAAEDGRGGHQNAPSKKDVEF